MPTSLPGTLSLPHLSQSCVPRLNQDFPALPDPCPPWLVQPQGRLPGSKVGSCPLTLCLPSTDRGTIHKVVESRDVERSLIFNIIEIQPFRRAATIQALSLDTERVSLPTPPLPYGATQ